MGDKYRHTRSDIMTEKAAATEKKKSKAAFLRWLKPLIQSLRDLGGSASPADAQKNY